MMKGVHAEIRSKFHHSVDKYVVTSRIVQGQTDLRSATVQEMQDIIVRFNSMGPDLRGLYVLKYKEKTASETPAGQPATASQDDSNDLPDSPPKTGFWNTRHMSLEERRKLHEKKDEWKRKKREQAAGVSPSAEPPEDPGMERAIRESVNQTSRGDPNEDAMIEAQIRSSVKEMRRIAEEQRRQEQQRQLGDWKQRPSEPSAPPAWADEKRAGGPGGAEEITDEEFEALIAEAARQSVIAQQQQHQGGEDEDLERALRESQSQAAAAGHGGESGADEELRRAMEESERAHREDLARRTTERSEEEVIIEYVKKQSLAEEEFRRLKAQGKQPEGAAGGGDEEDEDLKKAIEESLTLSGKQGGPSK